MIILSFKIALSLFSSVQITSIYIYIYSCFYPGIVRILFSEELFRHFHGFNIFLFLWIVIKTLFVISYKRLILTTVHKELILGNKMLQPKIVSYLHLKLSVTEDGLTAETGPTIKFLLWNHHIVYPTFHHNELLLY